jgi:hypothetical protein
MTEEGDSDEITKIKMPSSNCEELKQQFQTLEVIVKREPRKLDPNLNFMQSFVDSVVASQTIEPALKDDIVCKFVVLLRSNMKLDLANVYFAKIQNNELKSLPIFAPIVKNLKRESMYENMNKGNYSKAFEEISTIESPSIIVAYLKAHYQLLEQKITNELPTKWKLIRKFVDALVKAKIDISVKDHILSNYVVLLSSRENITYADQYLSQIENQQKKEKAQRELEKCKQKMDERKRICYRRYRKGLYKRIKEMKS